MQQYASNPSLAEGEKIDIRVYPKNRRCKKRDCSRLLSIYRSGPWCVLHETYGVTTEEEELIRRRVKHAEKIRKLRKRKPYIKRKVGRPKGVKNG